MTLFELMEQWQKPFPLWSPFDSGVQAGLIEAADELHDWLKVNMPAEFERYQQQKEATEQ